MSSGPWTRQGALAELAHLVQDLVGGLGPLEGLAILVVGLDVVPDGGSELWDVSGDQDLPLFGEARV